MFIGVVIAGIWLARATRDELKDGRKWFRLVMKLCLLLLAAFFVYWMISGFSDEILIAVLGLVVLAVLSFISLKKSSN